MLLKFLIAQCTTSCVSEGKFCDYLVLFFCIINNVIVGNDELNNVFVFYFLMQNRCYSVKLLK